MPENKVLEDRLRAHLNRVAQQPAPPKLEQLVSERVMAQRQGGAGWRSTLLVVVMIVVLVSLLTIVVGHQTNGNVFSNISSGLG